MCVTVWNKWVLGSKFRKTQESSLRRACAGASVTSVSVSAVSPGRGGASSIPSLRTPTFSCTGRGVVSAGYRAALKSCVVGSCRTFRATHDPSPPRTESAFGSTVTVSS